MRLKFILCLVVKVKVFDRVIQLRQDPAIILRFLIRSFYYTAVYVRNKWGRQIGKEQHLTRTFLFEVLLQGHA